MLGVGLLTALAIEAFAPGQQTFRCGRDLTAWLGLGPISSHQAERRGWDGYQKPGRLTSADFMIIGAMTQIS